MGEVTLHRGHVLLAVLGLLAVAPVVAEETGGTEVLPRLEALEQRIKHLEADNAALEHSLDEPYISADEPQVAARLKAVESQVNSFRRAARTVESLQGISTGVGLTMMAQGLADAGDTVSKDAELNYRADVTVSLPAGSLGNAEGFLFTHFRMGQGLGLQNPGDSFSSLNSTSFQRPGSTASDSTVLLAQAWYQLNVPLPLGGNPGLSRRHVELNFGKMDPFVFFDQNTIADDETRGFVNQAFVHNPLLDVGSDVGVDEFGFTPGLRLAFVNDYYKPVQYGLSVGVFGAGKGASFSNSLDSPFVIVQAETEQRLFSGLSGNYRLYAWRNGRGKNIGGTISAHTGVGLSFNQQVGDYTTLFLRAGWQIRGSVAFDRTLTLGGEWGGSIWNRGADAAGLAIGGLQTSADFRRVSAADYGYVASGAEQVLELYYRYHLNRQFEISPDLQYLRRPGGNGAAAGPLALGLRAQLTF